MSHLRDFITWWGALPASLLWLKVFFWLGTTAALAAQRHWAPAVVVALAACGNALLAVSRNRRLGGTE